MKKYSSILLALATLAFASSCAKEVRVDNPKEESTEMIDITIVASEKPEPVTAAGTKTFVDGSAIKWSDSGEILKVWEVATPSIGDAVTTEAESDEGVTSNSGAKITFGVSMTAKSDMESFDYYAIYPASSYQTGSSVTNISINTKAAQTPLASSFDPSQDLLIAKKVANGDEQATSLSMQFARMVAIGKMTVKNLESSDDITKITFSAKIGSDDVIIAGRTAFNLETGLPTGEYGSNTQEYSIILDYSGKGIKANSSMIAYFTCYPFALNSENSGSFKVVVETATHSFTKVVSLEGARSLVFKTGQASVFSVDMGGISGVSKAANLCYANLVPSDVALSESYGNVSVTKTHGDTWSMFAISTSGCIGVRRNDGSNDAPNDSYIKLPDFAENIKTVVVTLNSPLSGKTISLESSATATNGSIASLGTTTATVYTFDISSASVKTAYFRSHDFQSKVEKIEVYAGAETRPAIAAPASVTAALNSTTANSIDVTWSTVDGAAGYVITLVPDSGDDVVVKVASSPYTVTDLAYEMDYVVSVQAEPADYYVKKISAQTTASDVVTTGSNSTGEVSLTESEITMGSNTVKGTENGKLAYRLGTGDKNGSITFDSGYSSITFMLAGWASGTRSFTITNGKISDSSSLSPSAGSPSGTINDGFSRTDSGTEYTIIVDDPTEEVVFSGRRAIVWGFTAVEYVAPAVAAPSFSVAGGTYNTAQSVTISCATDGATIYYTTDGSDPDSGSEAYSSPISVNVSMTLKAIAIKASDESAITSATYTLKVATPTFSPAAGSYDSTQSVTISCATEEATIHYTVDGSTPTNESPTYTGAISVSASKTIKAIAIKSGWTNSDVASATYKIGAAPTVKTITSGTFSGDSNSLSMTTTDDVTISQLKADGSNCNPTYNTVSTLRVYRANQMQFTGQTFTRIEMFYTGSYSGADWSVVTGGGSVSIDTANNKVVWEKAEGSSTVNLQNSTASGTNTQLRTTKFVVTYK